MKAKKLIEFDERVVRIFDDQRNFRGTGILLNDQGWVLTCGHLFSNIQASDGVALKKEIAWYIQTIDGSHHKCEHLEEKFDDKCLFDYALFKAACKSTFSSKLLVRRNIEENVKAQMRGFSGNAPFLIRINGTIIGPSYSYDQECDQPVMQLLWEQQGSYTGFSGAPIFVKDSRIGTFLAGVQASEFDRLSSQFGTPLLGILNKSNLLSDTVLEISDNQYRRTGFRIDSVTELNISIEEYNAFIKKLIEKIKHKHPKLIGQISIRKLSQRVLQRISSGDKIVALVISEKRPKKVLVRSVLATHFRKNKWHQNMFEVMTEEELIQLRNYREYVKVFLFQG